MFLLSTTAQTDRLKYHSRVLLDWIGGFFFLRHGEIVLGSNLDWQGTRIDGRINYRKR